MKHLFTNQFFELYFDEEYALFKMVWLPNTQNMTDADFQEGLLKYVSYYHLKPKGVLHDMKNNAYILSPEMQDWANENINRKALEVGLTKVAFLMSDDIFALVSVQQTMDEKEGFDLGSAYFDDESKAWEWLKK